MLLEGGLQEEGNIIDKGMQDLHKHVLLVMRKGAAYKLLKMCEIGRSYSAIWQSFAAKIGNVQKE